jgi:hypothetical protein
MHPAAATGHSLICTVSMQTGALRSSAMLKPASNDQFEYQNALSTGKF